jgi:hypothetical protein
MNREHERDDLIDLGTVSRETRGAAVGMDDHQSGLIPSAGLGGE